MHKHSTVNQWVTPKHFQGEKRLMSIHKPFVAVLVACCALAGLLVWASVPALAAAPETPEVTVEALTPPTTAVVHGVLNPGVEGAPGTYEVGTYEFLYKQGNTGCVGESKAPVSPGIALGGGKEAVSETLSGLSPDTEYMVCLLVRDGIKGEHAVSTPVTFTTSSLLEAPVLREPASALTATTATFEGELNPGGATGQLSYQLDYNTNGTCRVVKASPEEPPFQQSTTPVEVTEASQLSVHGVEATELEPNETYTFCLVATNIFGEQAQGNEVSLQTEHQVPTITGVSVTNTTSTSATLSAEIYPHGEVTTYHVEYGTTNTYGASTPEASISAQHGPASIQAQLTGLVPNSEYHYRIIATNSTGTEQSPDAMFTTGETAAVGSQGLPDDRTFEMVTPPDNEDANVYVPAAEEASVSEGTATRKLFQVATDGSTVAYESDATSGGGNGEAGRGIGSQFLAKHLANGGWITKSIQPAGVFATEYQGFSSGLSVGVLDSGTSSEPEDPPLSEEALGDGYRLLYARTTDEGTYRPLFTKAVSPDRTAFESERAENVDVQGSPNEGPVFAGGSSGFTDMSFETDDALLDGAGALETELENDVKTEIAKNNHEKNNYLYDSAGGHLSLVNVSPEGRVVSGATFGGPPLSEPNHNPPSFGGAISGDGDRIYWSSLEDSSRPTGLYLRVNPTASQSPVIDGKCTVSGDACTVLVSGGEAQYWASAEEGRYAFYTEGEGLYRFNAEPEANQASRETVAGPSAGVLGVLGVSNNGESVYFVAKGVLAGASGEGAKPVEGEPNMYLWRDGDAPIFIGTLSGGDGGEVQPFSSWPSKEPSDGYFYGDWQAGLGQRTSRVTGSGGGVVFMSDQSLSVPGYPHGYPTPPGTDEVYVYEAGSNSLFCASCGSTREGASGYLPISWGNA